MCIPATCNRSDDPEILHRSSQNISPLRRSEKFFFFKQDYSSLLGPGRSLAMPPSNTRLIDRLFYSRHAKEEEPLYQTFHKHCALFRSLAPEKERLLKFDPRKCRSHCVPYLGKEVLDVSYPNLNDSPFTISFHEQLCWAAARKATVSVKLPVLRGVVAPGWYW